MFAPLTSSLSLSISPILAPSQSVAEQETVWPAETNPLARLRRKDVLNEKSW